MPIIVERYSYEPCGREVVRAYPDDVSASILRKSPQVSDEEREVIGIFGFLSGESSLNFTHLEPKSE